LVITPTTLSTLKTLKKQGIYLVILSTHPHLAKEAKIVLTEKVMHFKLDRFFNEVIATREDPSSKKQYILRTLKKLHLPKPAALMVGDSYKWDYLPARQAGIDPVLLDSVYRKKDSKAKKVQQVIQTVKEVLRYV
jgi:FMN phosphatase YigB (HAD superfamily)